jgi:hypothetical protein
VPGHCDIKGNKEVDRLARMGSDSQICGPEPCVPLSASIVRDMIRKWVTQKKNHVKFTKKICELKIHANFGEF